MVDNYLVTKTISQGSDEPFNLQLVTEWTCKLCSVQQENELYTVKEMMFGMRDTFEYGQCENCLCLQIISVPDNIEKYYPDDYYSFNLDSTKKFIGRRGFFRRLAVRAAISRNLIARAYNFFVPLKRYFVFNDFPISKSSRILDVGSGDGSKFLFPLAHIGFNKIKGLDPYLEQSISYSNGLKIEKSDIFEASGKWDFITFNHSFEHIPNPIETLKKVEDLLSDEGICAIRIPTVSSYAWEHYKTNWVQIDAPRHFFCHSIESMEYIGKISKLKLINVEYDSWHLQFSGSENYKNDLTLREKPKMSALEKFKYKLKKKGFKRQAKALNRSNQGDQAAFYFQKQ